MTADPKPPAGHKLSFFQTLGAVLWSFTGLRRGSDYRRDTTGLNPVYVIIAALLLTAVFVVGLLLVVRSVVG
ncbi:hypothetical protein PIGHUM_02622 [Pigmentiphaga humi]|uniref:DUF2970 domain-containing protein n=1 Tax=Pigmentiphaga humi TaxID=2478468 RepID=A0A3P4B4G7_9BURK|nr:DUF2970 domain-containing protein [Pigmentiphaga humi]VCU70550.1 hypothetical protein PIGHUM_02622 [Pigmentiphaga humi]